MTIIRKPNLSDLTAEGIPKDFADVMEYFNKGLEENAFPFIPRKTPITVEEIKTKWIPSIEENITLEAEENGKVIGQLTVFYNLTSTNYAEAEEREVGTLGLTINPNYNYKEVAKQLIEAAIQELKNTGRKAVMVIDTDFKEEREVMEELGLSGEEINNFERYQKAGLSGKVIIYHLQ